MDSFKTNRSNMSSVRSILQWNIRQKQLVLKLICPVYVVFYNGISAKNNLLAHLDLICPVYVTFYDVIDAEYNLLVNIDLICPLFVVFYNEIFNKNNLLALIDLI